MNKGVKLLIISMTVVIVLLAAGLYLFYQKSVESATDGPSVDEVVANSVEIPELITNLSNGQFIKIAFTIQTDSKETKQDLEKLNFEINNTIIKQLSGMDSEDLEGTEGIIKLEELLKSSFNSMLKKYNSEGEVDQVYITSAIFQ